MQFLLRYIVFFLFIVCSCNGFFNKKNQYPKQIGEEKEIVEVLNYIKANNPIKDSIKLEKLFRNLSDEQIEKIIDILPSPGFILPSKNVIIINIAKQWGSRFPGKVLNLIANESDEIQNNEGIYNSIMQTWLKNQNDSAEQYVLKQTISWLGPAVKMGEELRAVLLANKLKGGISSCIQWLDSFSDTIIKLKLAEALFYNVVNDTTIGSFSNWLKNQSKEHYFRFLCANFVKAYAQRDVVATMNWAVNLPNSSSRYLAICEMFTFLGANYPNIGVQWFNTAPGRYKIGGFDSMDKNPLSAANLRNDIIAFFIKALLNNHETNEHPYEIINRITDFRYRPLLIAEYHIQIRRLDPENVNNKGLYEFKTKLEN